MVDVEYIRKLHYMEGWSIRRISDRLGYARQTVRKALASAEMPRYRLRQPRPSPVMDPYEEVILGWLEADKDAPPKQRHTARRIYARLVEEYGFAGAESTVRRYVNRLRQREPEAFIPLTAVWGEQAQVDWGRAKVMMAGKETEVCLFCLRMKRSKVPFVRAFPTERLEAFLEGHRAAFEWLGGVPRDVLYDNAKTAVVKILAGPERKEQQLFSSMRAHYLFNSHFCRPGEAHEKGAVENLVGYVRRNTLVPLPAFDDLSSLNEHLLNWCERERERHKDDWQKERAALQPLAFRPFRCSISHMAKVNKLALVTHDRVRYSVPTQYVGRVLRLEVSADQVEAWSGHECVAHHRRSYRRGDTVLQLTHYLNALERKPRAVLNATVVRELPDIYATVRQILCAGSKDGYREFCNLLLLHREFTAEQIEAALKKGLELGSVRLVTIRQLLLNATAPSPPPPVTVPPELIHHQFHLPQITVYDALLEVAAG